MDFYGSSYEMPTDLMRYDLMTQNAMRNVVKQALERVMKEGLPGEHHFFVTFVTHAKGVHISDALKARYPQEMTIVLQHQFWGLEVTDIGFTVGLTFNKVPEKLVIPFSAIKGFFDPAVQFGLQFPVEEDTAGEGEAAPEEAPTGENSDVAASDRKAGEAKDGDGAEEGEATINWGDDEDGGAEDAKPEEKEGDVISLDAFRKK